MNTMNYTFEFSNNYNDFNNNFAFEDPVNVNWISQNLNHEFENEHQEKASTFAEEGSIDLENFESLDTAEPVTIDNLEQNVKKEIDQKGIDFALETCLKSKTSEKKKLHKKMRNKQTKTKTQIQRLEEELKKNPHRWTKQERIKIANEIGLTQVQVYKWYYDNTTGKATCSKESEEYSEVETHSSPKRMKVSEDVEERAFFMNW